MYIVTHQSPDWDALGATWLLKRYVSEYRDAEIKLVHTGSPDPEVLAGAAAVVDTGRVYDPAWLRFDHHQWPNNNTSAAQLVWEWLCKMEYYSPEYGPSLRPFSPLIELITAGDLGRPSARWSREHGLHAALSAWKAQRLSDEVLIERGFALLDEIASLLGPHDLDTSIQAALIPYAADLQAHQQTAQAARESLAQHTVYRSRDGLLVALDNAPQAASQAAFEAGARLVVFHSIYPETVAVGCARAGEWQEPHIGELVGRVIETAEYDEAAQMIGWSHSQQAAPELATWYRHAAGFFAGRGTPKAPDPRPLTVPIAIIAAALDSCWRR